MVVTRKGPLHWSPEDYSDIRLCAEIGDTVQTAAKFLGCTAEEVRQIAKECGVTLQEEPGSSESGQLRN